MVGIFYQAVAALSVQCYIAQSYAEGAGRLYSLFKPLLLRKLKPLSWNNNHPL